MKHAEKGFSLMEVLVAVVLLAISLPAMMYVQKGSWQGTAKSTRMGMAAQMVEKRLEMMQQSFPPTDNTTGVKEGQVVLSWSVGADPFPPVNPNIREVTFIASWQAGGKMDSLVVRTLVTRDF